MARLNNLLVTGISRFLDKIKTPKVETDNIESTNGKINTLKTKTISAYYGTQSGIDQFSTGSSGQVLTSDGTSAKWQNISTDSITSGTLPVSRGGTGKTTGADAANYFINSLETASEDPVDNDYYVSQYAGGGTTYTTFYRRPMSKLWNYIKSKISSWMKNNTSAGSLRWSSTANDTMPITSNTLAYWNGAYTGTTSNISCVGTIKNGQWNASTIGVSYGGTGAQTLTSGALLQGNGTSAISAAGGKGSASLPIYIDSSGKPQTITSYSGSIYQSNLQWGGKNFSDNFGCIDAAMISQLGANRFALIQNGITVEYSRDSGSTWTDYGASDTQKRKIFSSDDQWPYIYIGKANSSSPATSAYKLRITIDTGLANVYSNLNKYVVYISSEGSQGLTLTIQRALQSSPGTYTDIVTNIPLSGWSGYNVINTSSTITYGNTSSSQYGRLRFIFSQTGGTTNGYLGMRLSSIKAFGGMGWNTPSTLAKTGHLYSYNALREAYFPGNIFTEHKITANSANIENLVVNGDATFNNGLEGNLTGTINGKSCSLTMIMDTTDTKQLNISFT